jgi:hypothetical protein
VLAALHLTEPRHDLLTRLPQPEWQAALHYCDTSRLTLALRDAVRGLMPPAVRERVDSDAARNRIRVAGVVDLYRSLEARLCAAGLEFVALKGLTHAALFRPEWEQTRVQYDVDLYLPRQDAVRAQQELTAVGWEALEGMDAFPTDHLPALIRRTGWEWRGDFFDPEIPLAVELHFQFWNEQLERLPAPGVDEFWTRRTMRPVGGMALGMLSPPDALAYAALHLLKHLLSGSVKPFHVYEIASILDGLAGDDAFWCEWHRLHAPELRRLEAVTFRLAQEWFGGHMPAPAKDEIARLPDATAGWFEEFATAPVRSEFRPNKDELWLHLSLLSSRRDALSVARRKFLPATVPPLNEHAYIPESELTWRRRAVHLVRRIRYLNSRVRHHAMALPRAVLSGLRWWRRSRRR